MLYPHFSQVARAGWRWPNFQPGELSCHCCGEFFLHEPSLDALQRARETLGEPFNIHSGHRCPLHNARVGGAPLSEHKNIAFDVGLAGHDKDRLRAVLEEVGFRGIGLYQTFIHVDLSLNQHGTFRGWYGSNTAREIWTGQAS